MECFDYNPQQDGAALAVTIAERLRRGEVGIVPTETVYGLVCAHDHAAGIERIYAMKRRPRDKGLQVLICDLEQLAVLGVPLTDELRRLAQAFWPGPLTLVVATADGRTVGLRMPGLAWLRQVISGLGKPLAATSANLAGQDPGVSAATGFADLAATPDFVVYGPPPAGTASTVARLGEDGSCEVLRPGPISAAQLAAAAAPCAAFEQRKA